MRGAGAWRALPDAENGQRPRERPPDGRRQEPSRSFGVKAAPHILASRESQSKDGHGPPPLPRLREALVETTGHHALVQRNDTGTKRKREGIDGEGGQRVF